MNFFGRISFRKSIHSKIFISFMLIILLPSVMIGVSSYFISINILTQKVSSSFSETVLYVRNSVEKELYQMKQISNYIYVNKDLKDAIIDKQTDPAESIQAEDRVQEKLKDYLIATTYTNIKVIKVYGDNNFELSFGDSGEVNNLDNGRIINSSWCKEAKQNSAKILWAGIHPSFLKEPGPIPKYSISLFRMIKDQYYQKNLGVLYISFDPQIFSNLTQSLNINNNNEILILDNNDQVVNKSSSRGPLDNEILKELGKNNASRGNDTVKEEKNGGKIYFYYPISDFDWKVVGVIPISEVTKDNIEIVKVTVIAFVISIIFSSIIWFFVSSSIINPVKKLTRATKLVRSGNFDVKVNYSSENELGVLTSNFNFMLEKINTLMDEVVQENVRKKDAEYKALQAQINPHFLYNTLNSIRWMAIIQNAENIKKVVDALGRLLRNTTSRREEFITINEEIDNVRDYIYIQKIAYKNKFEVIWNVDETVLDYKCIKFILQPIIENSIFHGIEPKNLYGTIWINIYEENGFIVFSVKDDGVGMNEQQINDLLYKDDMKSGNKFSGIGISNVFDRIKLTYKAFGSMVIDSRLGEYTNIIIKFPKDNQ